MSHDTMDVDQSQPAKSLTLQNLSEGPLSSAVSNLSASSRAIPTDKDFHFYYNFDEFKLPVRGISDKSQSLLESIGSSAHVWGKNMSLPNDGIDEDAPYDWLVDVNDAIFERIDVSMDEFQNIRRREEEIGQPLSAAALEEAESGGFQLVYGKKKKKGLSNSMSEAVSGGEPAKRKDETGAGVRKVAVGGKAKVPFHIPTIRRPQEEYSILVNNSNQPFQHVWLQRSEDGQRFIHPLEKLSVLDFVDKNIDVEPVKPPSTECTPFKLVEQVKDLKELAAKLRDAKEFAVDLEHNQYRSFQGLTCLMQISTRTEDFIVDTLKLRVHVGPHLREVFKDPTKKKVMHGADRDIVWLQRDFGIYVCNLFDTGQASRVLKLERNSLEYLLHHFCGVSANKEYQNADWRLRPLPEEMVRYAREDTHYLLHIYDLMRVELFQMSNSPDGSDTPLVEVYKRSYDVCMQLYEKELLTENSYLHIYGLQGAGFNSHQLAVVAGLCEWRDIFARTEDESTGYIMPNKILLEIAKQMPVTTSKLRRLLRSKHPYVEHNLGSVVSVIRSSMQNAASFEDAAKQLKEGRMEAPQENIEGNDGCEVLPSDTSTNRGISNTSTENFDGGHTTDGSVIALQSASPDLKMESSDHRSSVFEFHKDCQGGSFKFPGSNGDSGGQTEDTNTCADLATSAKVTGATVQVLKKPSRGFGALLGNATSKRKFDTSKRETGEIKLEQIRTTVNLPFFPFSGRSEKSAPVVDVPARVLEPPCQESLDGQFLSSDVDEVIMLEDDSKFEDSPPMATDTYKEDNSVESAFEEEKEDNPMSLSDLSSSLEKCVHSNDRNRRPGKVKKAEEPGGGLQLKPFDYATARTQTRFGVDGREESAKEGTMDQKRVLGSGGRKKSADATQAQKDDGTGEFAQGRRRHAFPATGNRSATFR
ncbi:protein RRP6-like 2 isoform X2 [Tripterygium wilfordii]|uniref:protein RRP6-like 2 isoform X2 n=1 Tax=Tripterygium wilfordii TaxID=458696 RepID=UPI0018F7FA2C|nr:protein RRP6-like 2 isoform X2 [Tripterygium wilfordii]